MKKLTEWIRENLAESVGIICGTIAITAVVLFVFVFNGRGSGGEAATGEKPVTEITTTGMQAEKATTYKNSETNTSLEAPKESKEEKESTTEGETVSTEESSVSGYVPQQPTKVSQGQSGEGVTTKVNSQPQTTKVQPATSKPQQTTQQQTTAAPVRGKNGMIYEKLTIYGLKLVSENPEIFEEVVIKVPENNDELIEQTGNDDGNGLGYSITKNHYTVRHYRADIFANGIYVGTTKREYIRQLYGEPYKIDNTYSEYNSYRDIYRYGDGKNSIKDDIYICFDFEKNENNEYVLICIMIFNGVDTLE